MQMSSLAVTWISFCPPDFSSLSRSACKDLNRPHGLACHQSPSGVDYPREQACPTVQGHSSKDMDHPPGTLAQGLAPGHLLFELPGPLSGKTPNAKGRPACVWSPGCVSMSVCECRNFVTLCVCVCAHVFAGMEQTNLPHGDWMERKGTELSLRICRGQRHVPHVY